MTSSISITGIISERLILTVCNEISDQGLSMLINQVPAAPSARAE